MSLQGELLAMLETVAEALGEDLCQQGLTGKAMVGTGIK